MLTTDEARTELMRIAETESRNDMARGIYGEATSAEVRALTDEGIEFHALPVLPEDHN